MNYHRFWYILIIDSDRFWLAKLVPMIQMIQVGKEKPAWLEQMKKDRAPGHQVTGWCLIQGPPVPLGSSGKMARWGKSQDGDIRWKTHENSQFAMQCYAKSPSWIGKPTVNRPCSSVFNSYVSLPEGRFCMGQSPKFHFPVTGCQALEALSQKSISFRILRPTAAVDTRWASLHFAACDMVVPLYKDV